MNAFDFGPETMSLIDQGDGVTRVVPKGVQLKDHKDFL
jgi:phosphosulfolactate synthase (CoM biosynthesis protein A)